MNQSRGVVVDMRRQKLPVARRHELILRELDARGFVTTVDMARRMAVSEMTLRRDLDQLAERGQLMRSHGGGVALDRPTQHQAALIEPSLESREIERHEAKQLIAAHALHLIDGAKTLAIDIGSTTLALAQAMTDRPLRVFTSSLRVASALKQSRAEVYVPAGRIYGTEPSITGASAVDFLRNQSFDLAFLGASGITENGIYDYSFEDSEVKRVLIERSTRTVLLVDDSKFNLISSTLVARLKAIDLLVTNAAPPAVLQDALTAAGVQVEIAPPIY